MDRYYNDTRSDATYKWNALVNLSYKLNEFNKVSLMAMPNMSGTSSTRLQDGINPRDHDDFQQQVTHRYEGRELNIFQARGEHFMPASETKVRWNASHAQGTLNTPDLRVFFNNYRVEEGDTTYSINQSFYPSPTRYFRVLNENRTDIKLHVEQPLTVEWADNAKFSAGGSFVRTTRAHEENQFGFEASNQNLLNEVGGDLEAHCPRKHGGQPWRRF